MRGKVNYKPLVLVHYVGAKTRNIQKYERFFPGIEHNVVCFVDLFGGSASVTLNKNRTYKVEVINDINDDVVNLYAVVQSRFDEFYRIVSSLLYSRTIFEYMKAELSKEFRFNPFEPDIRRAVAFFYSLNVSFGGTANAFGYSKTENQAQRYARILQKLPIVFEKLRHVQVEHLPFEKVIEKYDSPNTFFFCDPPYLKADYYKSIYSSDKFTLEDHKRLIDMLNNIKGLYMVCGYDNELYNTELKYKRKFAYEWFKNLKKVKQGTGETRPRSLEVIWMNY